MANMETTNYTHTRVVTPEERRFYHEFVKALVKRRHEMKLSQPELNARLGMSDGMLGKWESMKRFPGAFHLMCWANALNAKVYIDEEEEV